MRVLNTVYVRDHRAHISLSHRSLLVSGSDGTRTRIPIESVDGIVLLGNAQITTQALGACVERNIRVASLRQNGRLRFAVGGPTSGNVHLRVAQHRAAEDWGATAGLARTFVAGKLQNYRRLLQRWSWDSRPPDRTFLQRQQDIIGERLANLASTDDGNRIRGIEGDATRRYFKGLATHLASSSPDLHFVGRSRRPPRDPVNALMSYLYGLVLTEIIGGLEAVGLDPQIGFLHGLRPGRPSLGLDLLEELRPAVADRLAVALITRRQIRLDHFITTPGGGWLLSDEGRDIVLEAYESLKSEYTYHTFLDQQTEYWAVPLLQATLLARHLRGDLPAYPPFVIGR